MWSRLAQLKNYASEVVAPKYVEATGDSSAIQIKALKDTIQQQQAQSAANTALLEAIQLEVRSIDSAAPALDMKGLIDLLLDGSSPEAAYLRLMFVWKVVPMICVDGVVNGNHRCSLVGRDLNREYASPGAQAHPVIHTIKSYMRHIKEVERRNLFFYCDLHGHSRKPNFFFYGCGAGKKTSGLVLEQVFPKLLSDMCPFFRFEECRFKVLKGKEPTGRVVMWKELGIRHSYTLEASMMGGGPRDPQDSKFESCPKTQYNTTDFSHMGKLLALAIGVFVKNETDASGSNPLNEIITSLLETAVPTRPPGHVVRVASLPNCLNAEDGTAIAGRLRRSSFQARERESLPVARSNAHQVLRASSAEVDAARHVLFHWVRCPPVPSAVKLLQEQGDSDDGDPGYDEDESVEKDSDIGLGDDDNDD